jgi:hypothetical protein
VLEGRAQGDVDDDRRDVPRAIDRDDRTGSGA